MNKLDKFSDKQKKLYTALTELWHLLGMGNREIQQVLDQVSKDIDALFEL